MKKDVEEEQSQSIYPKVFIEWLLSLAVDTLYDHLRSQDAELAELFSNFISLKYYQLSMTTNGGILSEDDEKDLIALVSLLSHQIENYK